MNSLASRSSQLDDTNKMKHGQLPVVYVVIDIRSDLSYKFYAYITPHNSFKIHRVKLVGAHLNYRFTTPFFLQYYLFPMCPLSRLNATLYFGMYGLNRAARNMRIAKKNEKLLSTVGFELTTLRFIVRLASD